MTPKELEEAYVNNLPSREVLAWIYSYIKTEDSMIQLMLSLYYPNIYYFSLDQESQIIYQEMCHNDMISNRYGSYEVNVKCPIDSETYMIVFENGD